jgi:uncharacterized membrane protein YedE/YeeE
VTRTWVAMVTGAIFAAGLALAGMTQPSKVIAFLDFAGDWDPSLAFVMGGAILFFAPLYFWAVRRERVAFGQRFAAPAHGPVDRRLVVGAALFGVGWGLGGYCPGPALTALGTGTLDALWFAGAMAVGMALYPWLDRWLVGMGSLRSETPPPGPTRLNP